MVKENQNIEWKESWRDEYLKWICGFANAEGGKLFIGINDNGEVIGINNAIKLLDEIPNKVRNHLGLVVDVVLKNENGREYIEISTDSYPFPVSYKGQYHYRSGSTKQELHGAALDKFLLQKKGKRWDSVPVPYISVNDLHEPTFKLFRNKAIQSKRLSKEILIETNGQLLEKLHLLENNYLTRATILLFHSTPEKYITGAYIKIGYFETDENLLFQDVIEGNLFEQVEKAMDILLTKYLKAFIRYERIYRIEEYPFPEPALREALINAVVHKDYSSGNPIQISVYRDKIMFWNEGQLPENWTVEKLKQKHSSIPYNPDIATAFFRAGMIEAWGRGTLNILNECKKMALPEPCFIYDAPGFLVELTGKPENKENTLNNPIEKSSGKSSGKGSGKSVDRILEYIKSNNTTTIPELAEKINISTRAIEKHIDKLQKENLIMRIGGRKYGKWKIIEENE